MTIRSALKLLLGFALGAPLVQTLLFWTAGLLAAMGDQAAADCLGRAQLASAVLWLASLVGLITLLAMQAINDPPPPDEPGDELLE